MFKSPISRIFVIIIILILSISNLFPALNQDMDIIDEDFMDNIIDLADVEENKDEESSHEDFEPVTRAARYLDTIMDLDSEGVQLTAISGDAYDNSYGNLGGGQPIATGDIDNDGFEDLMLGCPFADGKTETVGSAGQVLVIYGRNQTHPYTTYDQAVQNTDEINLVIHGNRQAELLGFSLASGDIDGDGYDDIIIGAPYADGKNGLRANSGQVYIIYGGTRASLGNEIDLRSTPPDLMVYGASGGAWPDYDMCGYSLSVGNVLGDSKEDLVIGAIYANPGNKTAAGAVHVIAGDTRGNLGTEIDLLTGGEVLIMGARRGNYAGKSVAVGDVNGDSRDDIIVGAYGNDPFGTRTDAGAAYVVYGAQTLNSVIDLNISADVSMYGAGGSDLFGYNVVSGNINGDQYDDILVSALWGDGPNNALGNSGEVYVIYGSTSISTTIDTNSNDHDIVIYGKESWDYFGYSLATGNMNGDLYDDILVGTIYGDGDQNVKSNSGETYLILGNSTASLGSNIDPYSGSKTIFYGVDIDDYSGRYVQAGDLDNDDSDDIIIFAPNADGPNNARDLVGEFYVIYGSAPPVKNEMLRLLNGDVDDNTVLAKYKEYIFHVNVSNILGYKDMKSVTLTIDPLGYNIGYRWSRQTNEFVRISGPIGYVECTSSSADVYTDKSYNYSIDFRLIFDWNFTRSTPIACWVSSQGVRSLVADDLYADVFRVNNKLNFKGELLVTGAAQGEVNDNSWVAGGEGLTFSGLTVVYNGTTDYYPPVSEYTLSIKDNYKKTIFAPSDGGSEIHGTVFAPELTIDNGYQLNILGLPDGSDDSSISIILKVDNDPPEAPENILCMADTFDEVVSADADNDPEIYVTWSEVTDIGSGTSLYYSSFEDNSGTNDGFWSVENKAKLTNASEGLNSVYVWVEDAVGNIGEAASSEIFIDLSDISYGNFTPTGVKWHNSRFINCTVEIKDFDGFGVDLGSIDYWDIQSGAWIPITNVIQAENPTFITVAVSAQLNEGSGSFIKFRAYDLVGNGPVESEKYYFNIDNTPIKYSEILPEPTGKQSEREVRCYITISDIGGSGVNLSTLQYSYSTAGLENFSEWSNSNLASIATGTDSIESSRWFVDIIFDRGAENYIRWRAMDIAGNGYTVSENYSVLVNAPPIIIIDRSDPRIEPTTKSDIWLSAERTYDNDDDSGKLEFLWNSNISGKLGGQKNFTVRLPAGRHQITLEVFDGYNRAIEQFNLTVQSSDKSKSSGTTSSLESMGIDIIAIVLLILIICIILLFAAVYSRERRKRRTLEEKLVLSGVPKSELYQPAVRSAFVPELAGGAGRRPTAEQFRIGEGQPQISVQDGEPLEKLPGVGGTTISGAPQTLYDSDSRAPNATGPASGTTPDVVVPSEGKVLPQLPPAMDVPKPKTDTQPTVATFDEQKPTITPSPTLQTDMGSEPESDSTVLKTKPGTTGEALEPDLELGFTPDNPEFLKRIKKDDE
jgi:hypothetical protein